MIRAFLVLLCLTTPLFAQITPFIPSFFDAKQRLEKPDMTGITSIRFLSDDDYPPFHFIGHDGQLTGFNIDLARAICDELKLNCTIQTRRWDTLLDAIDQNTGDAVIASIASTSALRQKYRFSAPYYRTPARFVGKKGTVFNPQNLQNKTVGVMAGSSHEAFLKLFFENAVRKTYNDPDALHSALKNHETDMVFGDAIGLSFWLNGLEGNGCCEFLSGAYNEPRFFGDGVGIALRKNDEKLQKAIDYALARLSRNGVFTTLYLKYFPIGFY